VSVCNDVPIGGPCGQFCCASRVFPKPWQQVKILRNRSSPHRPDFGLAPKIRYRMISAGGATGKFTLLPWATGADRPVGDGDDHTVSAPSTPDSERRNRVFGHDPPPPRSTNHAVRRSSRARQRAITWTISPNAYPFSYPRFRSNQTLSSFTVRSPLARMQRNANYLPLNRAMHPEAQAPMSPSKPAPPGPNAGLCSHSLRNDRKQAFSFCSTLPEYP